MITLSGFYCTNKQTNKKQFGKTNFFCTVWETRSKCSKNLCLAVVSIVNENIEFFSI